ncbi:hypothetical protein D9M68_491710 [compost metagenome]
MVQGAPGQPPAPAPERLPRGQLPAAGQHPPLLPHARRPGAGPGVRRPLRLLPAPGAGAQLLVPPRRRARPEHPDPARGKHQHPRRAPGVQHLRCQRRRPGEPHGVQRGLLWRALRHVLLQPLPLPLAARAGLPLVPGLQPQCRPARRLLRRHAVQAAARARGPAVGGHLHLHVPALPGRPAVQPPLPPHRPAFPAPGPGVARPDGRHPGGAAVVPADRPAGLEHPGQPDGIGHLRLPPAHRRLRLAQGPALRLLLHPGLGRAAVRLHPDHHRLPGGGGARAVRRHGGEDRRHHRADHPLHRPRRPHQHAQGRRLPLAPGGGAGELRKPGQEPLPGHDEPRDPHPAQWRAGHAATAQGNPAGPQPALLCRHHLELRYGADDGDQRHPRLLPHRVRQAGTGAHRVRPGGPGLGNHRPLHRPGHGQAPGPAPQPGHRRAPAHPGRSDAAQAGADEPARQRPQVHRRRPCRPRPLHTPRRRRQTAPGVQRQRQRHRHPRRSPGPAVRLLRPGRLQHHAPLRRQRARPGHQQGTGGDDGRPHRSAEHPQPGHPLQLRHSPAGRRVQHRRPDPAARRPHRPARQPGRPRPRCLEPTARPLGHAQPTLPGPGPADRPTG